MKHLSALLVAGLLVTSAQAQVVVSDLFLSAELVLPPPGEPGPEAPRGTADGLFDAQTQTWYLDIVCIQLPTTGILLPGVPVSHSIRLGDANQEPVKFETQSADPQTGTEYRNRLTGTGDIVGGSILLLMYQQVGDVTAGVGYLQGTILGAAVPEPAHYAVGLGLGSLGLVLFRRLRRR